MLWSTRDWIDPETAAGQNYVEIVARDQSKVPVLLTTPKERSQEKLPLIVIPHGGPFGVHDSWRWSGEVQALASRGYMVVQPNFRGSSGRGQASIESARFGLGSSMIDDIVDATRWAIQTGMVDPARICIFGGSYGGFAALAATIRHPELYRCAVTAFGVYDLNKMKRDAWFADNQVLENYIERYIGDRKIRKAQSPSSSISMLKSELLVVHGLEDTIVPVDHARNLIDDLERHGIPHVAMLVEGEGHGFRRRKNRLEFLEQLIAFLDRNLKDREPAKATDQSH